MPDKYDFAIVGSGAGGATAFYILSKMGFRVVLLEAGPDLREEYAHRTEDWVLTHGYVKSGANAIWGFPPIAYGEGRLLGGTTELNGGLLWDTPSHVFEEWRRNGYLDWVSQKEIDSAWREISQLLSVGPDDDIEGHDHDSRILAEGFSQLGLAATRAQRATRTCLRSNRCAFGCPSGAKQSMGITLIPQGIKLGGEVFPESEVVAFRKLKEGGETTIRLKITTPYGTRHTFARRVILAGGINSTPNLIRKALGRIFFMSAKRIHINIKVWAISKKSVESQKGTIFTEQFQGMVEQGLLMMPSQSSNSALLMSAAALNSNALKTVFNSWKKVAIFTVQSSVLKDIHQVSTPMGTFSTHLIGQKDLEKIKIGILKLIEALSGPNKFEKFLISTVQKSFLVADDIRATIDNLNLSNLDISSVHGMSAAPIGSKHIDTLGRLRSDPSFYVMDASSLPSETVESPQGSVMQMAYHLACRAGKDLIKNSE